MAGGVGETSLLVKISGSREGGCSSDAQTQRASRAEFGPPVSFLAALAWGVRLMLSQSRE